MKTISETEVAVNRARCEARSKVIFDTALSPAARLVYMALDDYAGSKGKAWPHQSTLAKRIGMSIGWVNKALRELASAGYVAVRRRMSGNLYSLTEPVKNRVHKPSVNSSQCTDGIQPGVQPFLFNEPVHIELDHGLTDDPPVESTSEKPEGQNPSNEVEKREMADTGRAAIRRSLEQFDHFEIRDREGNLWIPEQTADALMRAAERLKITPFAIASYLSNRYQYVARRPGLWPQSPYWFTAAVDNHFGQRLVHGHLVDSPHGIVPAAAEALARPVQREVGDVEFSRDLVRAAVAGVGGMR